MTQPTKLFNATQKIVSKKFAKQTKSDYRTRRQMPEAQKGKNVRVLFFAILSKKFNTFEHFESFFVRCFVLHTTRSSIFPKKKSIIKMLRIKIMNFTMRLPRGTCTPFK